VTLRRTLLTLAAGAAVLQGCACDSVPDAAVTACELTSVVPGAVKTDILFVVDDSFSMDEEVANLETNLSSFISTLNASPVANDYQIGVTTTSVSDFSDNPVNPRGALIGPILQGSSGTLVADFQAQLATIRTRITNNNGSGKEQPLRAMRLALSSPLIDAGNANEGFLRAGARLAVVFLSDEDDNSESSGNVANSNVKTHNDSSDGRDYKGTVLDPVGDYVAFLRGSVGGEVRDVVAAVIAGVDAATLLPTCGDTANSWCCGSTDNDVCAASVCGVNSLTLTGTTGSVTGETYCCGDGGGGCTSPCATAYDKADRLVAFMEAIGSGRTVKASVCDASFASSLDQIAGLIVSPTLPLEGAPADYRMLVVRLRKASSGNVVPCTVGLTAGADTVYAPPAGDSPATLTFEVAVPGDGDVCKLDRGDQILIDLVCAG